MTKPKPSFDSPKERGVNEEALQKFVPPTKEVGGTKRAPVETPTNDETFSK